MVNNFLSIYLLIIHCFLSSTYYRNKCCIDVIRMVTKSISEMALEHIKDAQLYLKRK